MLGLASNGTGVAAEFDPKNGFRFKFGLQQSNTDATNLSDSLFTLSEVGYTFTPFSLPEGTYRVWFRTDNTSPTTSARASAQLRPEAHQRGRPVRPLRHAGSRRDGRDHFYSAGVGFQNGLIFNPQDTWGVGYSQMDLASGDREKLVEGYYNLLLTETLRLSFHLHARARDAGRRRRSSATCCPGVRLQAAF